MYLIGKQGWDIDIALRCHIFYQNVILELNEGRGLLLRGGVIK